VKKRGSRPEVKQAGEICRILEQKNGRGIPPAIGFGCVAKLFREAQLRQTGADLVERGDDLVR
jgi:hypothetical protein